MVHKVHPMILIPVFGLEGVGHYTEDRFFATSCHNSFIAPDDYYCWWKNGAGSITNSGEPRYTTPSIAIFMHIWTGMSGNIILRADFSQPLVISLLQLLMTVSAAAKMALGLLVITENQDTQDHLYLLLCIFSETCLGTLYREQAFRNLLSYHFYTSWWLLVL